MRSRLLVGLLISLLAGCASAPSNPRARLVLGDREIRAGNGTFVFREVVLMGTRFPALGSLRASFGIILAGIGSESSLTLNYST
jgi:hypothetical protein